MLRTSGLRVTFDLRFDKPLLWLVCSRCGCMLKTHLSACVAYTNNILRHIIHKDQISLCYRAVSWTSLGSMIITKTDATLSISSRSCPTQHDHLSTAFWLQTAKRSQATCNAARHWPSATQYTATLIIAVYCYTLKKTTGSEPITPTSLRQPRPQQSSFVPLLLRISLYDVGTMASVEKRV
jgi:hypothetical protein